MKTDRIKELEEKLKVICEEYFDLDIFVIINDNKK